MYHNNMHDLPFLATKFAVLSTISVKKQAKET